MLTGLVWPFLADHSLAADGHIPHPCLAAAAGPAVALTPAGGPGMEFAGADGARYRATDIAGQHAVPATPGRRYFARPAGPADRWGTVPAWIEAKTADGTRTLWQEDLIKAAEAVFAPETASMECADRLHGARAKAGTSQDGTAPASPLPASRPDLLAAHAGGYVIARGRLVSLGKTERTRYLNFGRDWSSDLTATISSKDAGRFEAWLARQGANWDSLDGQRLEVRGFVTLDRGPSINLTHPAQIRVLTKETADP
ncbi:hypothetical protein GCM10011316_08930 [Roseibium aquae]|uniref:Uncharacterized protein n=1 Tax=Roseibium aquae TaxID=1323746 RepID=A0A916TBQ3_9HYPH|nr:hypothetical protein [Roseibium aquae]GGB39130.1 hypothetical protein GCM10011316_08930 [Roseibium aquae]